MEIKYLFYLLISAKLSFALFKPSLENSYFQNECVCNSGSDEDIKNAIKKSIDYIEKVRIEDSIPGVVAGISIKGKDVMTEAFGQTDIENDVKTHKDSVWRVASVSKALTSVMIGKLIEKGLIDLEKSIHHYLSPKIFPIKQWNNKNVTITVKQVMSHTAGLRVTDIIKDAKKIFIFKNVTQTVEQFKDEPLISEPGTKFNYSNYGFQILGAIIESVLNETYENAMNKMFKELGMSSTFTERHEMIIPLRARYYLKNKYYPYYVENWKNITKDEVLNAPIVDDIVSFEAQWPCGGFMSTVANLLKFGNYMLNSYSSVNSKSGHLNSSTIQNLWSPNTAEIKTEHKELASDKTYYAKGWLVTDLSHPISCSGDCKTRPIKKIIWHTGGISGESTIVAIFPEQEFVIVVMTNLGHSPNIFDIVLNIAKNFA